MKTISALAVALSILAVGFQSPVAAGEQLIGPVAPSVVKEGALIDCSKETWPDFSAACLSNDRAIEVRKVSVNRLR